MDVTYDFYHIHGPVLVCFIFLIPYSQLLFYLLFLHCYLVAVLYNWITSSTRDMLFILQLVVEKTLELEEKEVYLIFVDYSKAFDTVDYRMLFETMIEMGIPYHLMQLIEGLYINQEAAVRWNGQLTDWFQIGQGCNVSPTKFNIYGKNIIRRVEEKNKRGAVIGGRRMTNLRYMPMIQQSSPLLQAK